jgi:hypothetical protein
LPKKVKQGVSTKANKSGFKNRFNFAVSNGFFCKCLILMAGHVDEDGTTRSPRRYDAALDITLLPTNARFNDRRCGGCPQHRAA